MRGRYTAATWLFAVLIVALLAIGARAPGMREGVRHKAARARLERLAADAATLTEDASIRPESGCFRDRHTALAPSAAPIAAITPTCEAADPSARDYAFAEMSRELCETWKRQEPGRLEPTRIVFVSAEPPLTFSWARWQAILAPDLAPAADQFQRQAESVCELIARQWERWEQVIVALRRSQSVPTTATKQAQLPVARYDLAEREERSVLLGRETKEVDELGAALSLELAEREEQSVLRVR